MERRQTLQSLRQGEFPPKFASCAGHQSAKVKECVTAMLTDDAEEMPSISDLKGRLMDVLTRTQRVEVSDLRRSSST